MSDKDNTTSKDAALKGQFAPGVSGKVLPALFTPDELDVFVNKLTLEAYIFHGKIIDYDAIDYLEYNPADYSVIVIKKDSTRFDLGVKIQWLIRPYFSKAEEVSIIQTENGKSINGCVVPLRHKVQ